MSEEIIYLNVSNSESKEELATSFYQKNIEAIQQNISDVPKNETIILDNNTIFRFSCTVNNTLLTLRLSEIGSFAPYIYETELTLEDIHSNYKMFRSCDTLEEVKSHINKLFTKNQFVLKKEKEGFIKFIITTHHISKIEVIEVEAKRIMTYKKDEALLKLYKIQKDEIKLLKEIEKLLSDKEFKESTILNKFNEIKKLYQ